MLKTNALVQSPLLVFGTSSMHFYAYETHQLCLESMESMACFL